MSPRAESALVAALALLPLLPFLDAAVSIDAPVFLAVSRQILAAPADPFGFEMVWDPLSPHAAFFNQNPPLLSYYLAPFVAAFGESEVALHAALLPFPLIAALSFLGIARRVAGGLAPTALLLATPAFVVLASTLMLDVPALALLLLAVYAMARSLEAEGRADRWQLAAGLAAAAAGLVKYVGGAAAPLLGAGAVLFFARPALPLLRMLGLPVAIWVLWGVYTAHVYGRAHFLGATAVAAEKGAALDELWTQVVSVPVYYGAALVFPVFAWARGLLRGSGIGWVFLLLGLAVAYGALPEGRPARRNPLELEETLLAGLAFAGATLVWSLALHRVVRSVRGAVATGAFRPGPGEAATDAFLAVWLLGFLAFSLLVNWHVNAADALLAAPPALLLLYRTPALRPSSGWAAIWVGVSLGLALLLARAEAEQAETYRSTARRIADEIGGRPGARWFVGNWGLQYYLEREGFRAVSPPSYGPEHPPPVFAVGDWIVSARNLTQMDVSAALDGVRFQTVWTWQPQSGLPLRTNHPDAGAGFYSHHVGYVPFAWSREPLERVGLGRVTAAPR